MKCIATAFIVSLFLLSCSNAQDNYTFIIGKGITEFPIEFRDMGPVGITDITVYGDSVYTLENSRIHILSLKGDTGRYVAIPLGKDEKAVAINVLSTDSIAVVISYSTRRSASVLLLSLPVGKILNRIDYRRDAGSNDDQIVIEDNQSTAYINGKLYIPVTDTRNLDNDPTSFLVVDLSKKKYELLKQSEYFKKGYVKANTITSFCDGTQLSIRITRDGYQARINDSDKNISIDIKRNGEILNIPFKLDCRYDKLWYWQIVNDRTVVISRLKLTE